MTTRNLTCHELDERLGDYLDGTLDDSSVADIELHLQRIRNFSCDLEISVMLTQSEELDLPLAL